MKTCTKCGEVKELALFNKLAASPDGLTYQCKACAIVASRARYLANREACIAQVTEWQKRNPEKVKGYAKKASQRWTKANPEKVKAFNEKWAANNPEKIRAKDARKKPHVARAKTNWDPEFDVLVEYEAHDLAIKRTTLTGLRWEVDHIVPLRGKTVCGLHNGHNLAVVTAAENQAKRNIVWPQM